jgi:hypothetical protein
MGEAAATFQLAVLAAESLHGADRVALDAVYRVDHGARTIEVDRSTSVGCTLALVFLGYARREFGADAFKMRRLHVAMAGGEGEL